MMMRIKHALVLVLLLSTGLSASSVLPGSHLWDLNEVFSNSDGTIQFVEVYQPTSACCENNLGTKWIESTATSSIFTFPTGVVGNTAFKHILIGTAAFAALPGAPTPDFVLPDNFLGLNGDTITFYFYDEWIYAASQLPLDGVTSLQVNLTSGMLETGVNSPTNYSDVTGSVDAGGPPPAPVSVSFSMASDSVTEAAGIYTAAVVLSSAPTSDIAAGLTFSGTASSGIDYSVSGMLLIPAGSLTVDVPITIIDDTDIEPDETAILSLQVPPGVVLGMPSSFTLTIGDDDAPPLIDFVRGDTNADGAIGIADAIFLLTHLFSGGSASCLNALDANDDGGNDVADAISLLTYLFGGGAAPTAPVVCGQDPTPGSLDCVGFAACP
ncbi:MAG TPA: hypothetical protein EYF93_06155 [Planctomycetes bacterium]|nr:hypothetical protein [Planctomycetota bacterium]